MQKQVVDIIVDIITGKNIVSRRNEAPSFKKGFYLQKPYLPSGTTLKNQRLLVNREWVERELQQGTRIIVIPSDAIVTPMARLFLDEKRIKVQKE